MSDIKINIVTLNNKSRKGIYLYVKGEKGTPARYYKFTNDKAQIDATKQYYVDKYVKKKSIGTYKNYQKAYSDKAQGIKPKQRTKAHRQAEQYISKIKKRGSIASNIKRGVQSSTIQNILSSKTEDLTKIKKELLEDLVLDKDLLNLLITDENFNKLKNRLEYTILAKDRSGSTLIEASVHGKTLNEVKNEIQKALNNNMEVSKTKYRFLDYLKKLGWEGERKKDGVINNVQLTVVFRKG